MHLKVVQYLRKAFFFFLLPLIYRNLQTKYNKLSFHPDAVNQCGAATCLLCRKTFSLTLQWDHNVIAEDLIIKSYYRDVCKMHT